MSELRLISDLNIGLFFHLAPNIERYPRVRAGNRQIDTSAQDNIIVTVGAFLSKICAKRTEFIYYAAA